MRSAAAAGAALLLASCAQNRYEPNIETATVNREVPLTKAFVAPPPGGPQVLAVLQDIVPNAVSQEIALSTLSRVRGQNAFYVTLFRADQLGDGELNDRELTPELLRKEMNSRFPGLNMQTSQFYVQNKYGPFGYAIGRSRLGDLCIYGWQRIVPNEDRKLWEPAFGTIGVRLRICDERASEAALLSLMYGYTINAYYLNYGWNPYGPPPPVPASIGQIDAPISPIGNEGMGSVLNGNSGPPALPTNPPSSGRRPAIRRGAMSMSSYQAPSGSASPVYQQPASMRGYQQNMMSPATPVYGGANPYQQQSLGTTGYRSQASGPPMPAATAGAPGGYVPPGTYSAPTARALPPVQQTPVPPTPLTGYPVVPQPGGQGGSL